jgi:hypothetical protein
MAPRDLVAQGRFDEITRRTAAAVAVVSAAS